MTEWLLSMDPQTSEWMARAGFALFLLSFAVWTVLIGGREYDRERKAFFEAHPGLRDASNIEPHSIVDAVVMWDVERDVFVARCPEVSDLSGQGGTVDDACRALQKALYERARIGTLRRDMKIVTTRALEVDVRQDVPGADGGAACASC